MRPRFLVWLLTAIWIAGCIASPALTPTDQARDRTPSVTPMIALSATSPQRTALPVSTVTPMATATPFQSILPEPTGSLIGIVRTDQGTEIYALDLGCLRQSAEYCQSQWKRITTTPKGELPLGGELDDFASLAPSPDGRYLAFSYLGTQDPTNWDIYSLDIHQCMEARDGCGEDSFTRLTSNPASDQMPAWSPGGEAIAYVSNQNGLNTIFLTTPEGEGQDRVSPPSEDQAYTSPAWSPDGRYLAFCATLQQKGAGPKVFVTDVKSWFPKQVSTRALEDPVGEYGPAWHPTEGVLSFESLSNGQYKVFDAHMDDLNISQAMAYQVHPTGVSWDPTGTALFVTGPGEFGGDRSSVWVLNTSLRARQQVSHFGYVVAVVWSATSVEH